MRGSSHEGFSVYWEAIYNNLLIKNVCFFKMQKESQGMKRMNAMILLGILSLFVTACNPSEMTISKKSESTSPEKEEVQITVDDAEYIIYKYDEDMADDNKDQLVIDLQIENNSEQNISMTPFDHMRLLDGDNELEPDTEAQYELGEKRTTHIAANQTKQLKVVFYVETDQLYDIAIEHPFGDEDDDPLLVPLDTDEYVDSFEKLDEPAKALEAYVKAIYLDEEHPDFERLVAADKEQLQDEAEEIFYKKINRTSSYHFPEQDLIKNYRTYQSRLAEVAEIEAKVRKYIDGEVIVDFEYVTLSMDNFLPMMEQYEKEYNDQHGFDPQKANKYAASHFMTMVDYLNPEQGEWYVVMKEKDGKWLPDPEDYTSHGIIDAFVEGKAYSPEK